MILKPKMSFSQYVPIREISPSDLVHREVAGASSTATMSPIRSDVSMDALQIVSLMALLSSDVVLEQNTVSLFFFTSNAFSSFSRTTGLKSGPGSMDVWSTHELKAVSAPPIYRSAPKFTESKYLSMNLGLMHLPALLILAYSTGVQCHSLTQSGE